VGQKRSTEILLELVGKLESSALANEDKYGVAARVYAMRNGYKEIAEAIESRLNLAGLFVESANRKSSDESKINRFYVPAPISQKSNG
jgi:hypothetical protein